MSLTRIALRIAAVEALKGKTLVGDNVLDSPNGALDVQADGSLRTDEEKPFISVYTDQSKVENVGGRTLTENGLADIVFEMGISAAMTELDPETGLSTLVGINVPASDSTKEFFLDIVQRQLVDALNDPDDPWAEIYRGLHYRVRKIEYVGARNADDGQRLAGHQMRITVELADDPVKGEPMAPEAALLQFVTKLAATNNEIYKAQATAMQALLGTPADDLKVTQRRHGLTAAEMKALGLEVSPGEDTDQPAVATDATLEISGREAVTVEEGDA